MKHLFILILAFIMWSCAIAPDTYVSYDKAMKFNNYKTFAWLPHDAQQCEKADGTVYSDLFNNQITIRTIKKNANEELLNKGFVINVDTPDFLIQYRIIFEKKEHVVSAPVVSQPGGYLNNLQPYTNAPGIPIPNTYNRLSGNYTIYSGNYTYVGGGNMFPGFNNVNNGLTGSYYGGYYNNSYNGYGNGYSSPLVVSNFFEKTDYNEGTVIIDIIDRKTSALIWRGWSQTAEENPATVEASVISQIKQIIRKFPG